METIDWTNLINPVFGHMGTVVINDVIYTILWDKPNYVTKSCDVLLTDGKKLTMCYLFMDTWVEESNGIKIQRWKPKDEPIFQDICLIESLTSSSKD